MRLHQTKRLLHDKGNNQQSEKAPKEGGEIYNPRQWELAVGLRKLIPGLCDNQEGWSGVGGGKGVQEEGTYVYLWLIHVDVWQKPTQYCKAIILQLKVNKF